MSDVETSQTEVYVLRRVASHQWDRTANRVYAALFALRPKKQGGYELGLSVYSESKQTPRSSLQKLINPQRKETTVEELVAKGWRVARVPISAFPSEHFRFGKPDKDGHIEIEGTPEDFRKYAADIAKASLLLTAEECLVETLSDS